MGFNRNRKEKSKNSLALKRATKLRFTQYVDEGYLHENSMSSMLIFFSTHDIEWNFFPDITGSMICFELKIYNRDFLGIDSLLKRSFDSVCRQVVELSPWN